MFVIFFFYQRRNKKKYGPSPYVSQSISSYPSSVTDREIGNSNYFGAALFSYAELEEATKNFDSSKELGEGGFGTVYYGKSKHTNTDTPHFLLYMSLNHLLKSFQN
jgi:hypothetical protein